jgi:hypothetical protein
VSEILISRSVYFGECGADIAEKSFFLYFLVEWGELFAIVA